MMVSVLKGPDLLNHLFGCLQRFRLGEIPIVADVKAMFHQVCCSPVDLDSLRFLWKEDLSQDGSTG